MLGSRLAAADLLGCDPAGVVFSRSMTEATFMVARTLANDWGPGDRVVVTDLDHDANVRPWVTYAEKAGAEVAWARLDPTTGELPTSHIVDQITDNTRLVAVTGASNVVGTRPDLPAIAEAAHAVKALFFVDGVHLTAHAPIDVEEIGADFYACSAYKFLGPHLGIVAASSALWESLHPDKLAPSTEQVPERFELGTLPYELLAGLIAAVDVLADLVPGGETSMTRRDRLVRSMTALAQHEDRLHARLRSALEELPGITMYAHAHSYRVTPWVLIIGGFFGLLAAFELTLEKIAVTADPNYIPECDINPVLSCGSIITTDQASAFGFPNPIMGLIGFPVVISMGVLLLSKVELPRWVWLGLNLGALFGFGFAIWLITQSLYVIGALCPWCMVVWAATIPVFWIVTADNAAAGRLSGRSGPGAVAQTVGSLRWVLIGASYLVVLALIFIRWMDFWLGN
ncbi:MAG: aminotransferase class V-fold PLP-dependent enzyme [Actinobacteria bacterium]|nr:aminotransferase class V-fold PLP-dependent enzyme [Actinomycetota bacterium]